MRESEYKKIIAEDRRLTDEIQRLEWEQEQYLNELEDLGFPDEKQAAKAIKKWIDQSRQDRQKLERLKAAYDKRYLDRIETETD